MTACSGLDLTEEDNGGDFTILTGDTLTVRLDSNPSTGYAWLIAELDEEVLENTDQDFQSDANPSGAVGVGGTDIWTFTGVSAGTTTLALEYKQGLGEDIPSEGEFEVVIEVTDPQ